MDNVTRLSSAVESIAAHYTVVVVGSGYGGGIAAARFARAGQRVCLLERGKERTPGEFPDTDLEAAEQMQLDAPEGRVGSRTGLFDFRVNREINVFVGCGLGGTSLVNANVSIRPDPRLFEDERWPVAIRKDPKSLDVGYARAEEMLKPHAVSDNVRLPKLDALQKSADAMRAPMTRARVNVNFEKLPGGLNHVGVSQPQCTMCGDCVTGCNSGAKNTTLMNYLPDAVNHGAEIFTECEVRRVSRAQDGTWNVHYRLLAGHREIFDAPEQVVNAEVVVLAAGTLGSTEILLRSRATGLSTSALLGERFSGNGDVLGFAYNCDQPINGIGWGHRRPIDMAQQPVGPCITGVIDLRDVSDPNQGMIIEEGSLPGVLARILPQTFAAASRLSGTDTDNGALDKLAEAKRELDSGLMGAYFGATDNTATYLVMAHEKTSGRMQLIDDRLRISWPGIGDDPIFQRIGERLEQATKALGGTFVINPLWTEAFQHHLITVHPLGGCVMGDSEANGVVDHKGQVFAGSGSDVHLGLHVIDGSIVPRPLGCNPLITISALAERACALTAAERGWTIDYALPSKAQKPVKAPKLGIEFTERMAGHVSTDVHGDYRAAEADGLAKSSPFEFVLTIAAADVSALVSDERYESRMTGTALAPALSTRPFTVTDGFFTLLATDPDRPEAKQMHYRMQLHADDGAVFCFEGFKLIKSDTGLDLWSDTTTLYVKVSAGAEPGGATVATGILHIAPTDFMKQLWATRALNARNDRERLLTVARFGKYFAGSLFDVYGGIFAGETPFKSDAPPRKKRPLRVTAPEIYPFVTADQTELRLTRYRGGSKGPVMLAHGLGVSSSIFSIDTIETNLLEFLFAHGYDVWLLDFRSSIDLPAHHQQYSGDDIARQDFPASVAKVLELTGAENIQVVAHCFGATTFTMAMLAGLQGVRSAVISQISTHVYTPLATRIKTGLHVPEFLHRLGVTSLTAYTDEHADWKAKLFDRALELYPTELDERCRNPSCHRITFLYAPLYEHAQLNSATHDALHEMFGEATISAFEHLGKLSNAEHLVAADGSETYMKDLKPLAIPMSFIHGAENGCFLPKSTEQSLAALSAVNGPELYRRQLIPGYGHIDCIFGKDAVRDVYPYMLEHLERT